MNIRNLLEKIKLGEENYEILTLREDIENDFIEEESVKYLRTNKRLNKIANKIEEKGFTEIAEEISRIAKIMLPLEKKFIMEEEIRKTEARAKVIEIKRSYDRITTLLKDRGLLKDIRDKNSVKLIGEAFGTILFSVKPVQKIAETTYSTSLMKDRIPSQFKESLNREMKYLKDASSKNIEDLPM
jgi:agmatine/peptidylarginine deiminase